MDIFLKIAVIVIFGCLVSVTLAITGKFMQLLINNEIPFMANCKELKK